MNILILSDLHFEFYSDGGKKFVARLADRIKTNKQKVDVCILAGDIAVGPAIPDALKLFCDAFPKVLYVHGNHEFYGYRREQVVSWTMEAKDKNANLYWLDNGIVTIENQRFLGTPLWFKDDPYNDVYKDKVNCFKKIVNFKSWVYEENKKAISFLEREMLDGDIIISHYLPHDKSIAENYKSSSLNRFYVCDISHILNVRTPKLMIHGHTHISCDYYLGDTRVVCNPFGYYCHEVNGGFKKVFLLEV